MQQAGDSMHTSVVGSVLLWISAYTEQYVEPIVREPPPPAALDAEDPDPNEADENNCDVFKAMLNRFAKHGNSQPALSTVTRKPVQNVAATPAAPHCAFGDAFAMFSAQKRRRIS